jgi:hypothetical protein
VRSLFVVYVFIYFIFIYQKKSRWLMDTTDPAHDTTLVLELCVPHSAVTCSAEDGGGVGAGGGDQGGGGGGGRGVGGWG